MVYILWLKKKKKKRVSLAHLFGEEGRFVGSISGRVASSSHGLHVRHGHTQDGELIWFPGKRAAGGHHVRQLGDVLRHFVTPAPLNLAVVLSAQTNRKKLALYMNAISS